jgi:hypothetical protein
MDINWLASLKLGDLVALPISQYSDRNNGYLLCDPLFSGNGQFYVTPYLGEASVIKWWIFPFLGLDCILNPKHIYVKSLYDLRLNGDKFLSGFYHYIENKEYSCYATYAKNARKVTDFKICKKCRNLCQQHCPNYSQVYSNTAYLVTDYYMNHEV